MAASFCSARSVRTWPTYSAIRFSSVFLLAAGHVGGCQSLGPEGERDLGAVVGQDVQRRFIVDGGGRLLILVEAFHQMEGQVLAVAEDAESLLGALANLGGIGAEKERGNRDDVIAPHAEMQRDVMPLAAPAPRLHFLPARRIW